MASGGSVGTLVAAALETAGYQAQAMVLADLGEMLTSLGALFFIGAAVSAMITIGLMGNYRAGAWFFIGPGLFYFVIGTTVTASGSDWQFGAFQGDDERVQEVLDTSPTARPVSWIFNAYNRLISGLYQDLIGVVTNNNVRAQIMFMTRQRIMDRMFSAQLTNGGLLSLIHSGLQGQCERQLNAARMVAYGNRDLQYKGTPAYKDAAAYLATIAASPNSDYKVKLTEGTPAYNYVTDLIKAIQQHSANGEYNLDCGKTELNDFVNESPRQFLQEPLTCEQIWCFSGLGIAKEANALKADTEDRFLTQFGDVETEYPDIYAEIWHDIAVKLSPPSIDGSYHPDVSLVPVIIGGILLRKTLTTDPRSRMFSDINDHSGVYTRPYKFNLQLTEPQLQDVLEKMNNHQQAVSLQYETYTFAMALPYIQGIILYALSVAFPFFAILVIIPGKANALFTWMAIWAWAKSWDVGYAFVMVVDEILWNLMPHTSVFDPLKDANHGPVTIFESAFHTDPAYSLSNYYNMLSVMLVAVPLVSAQLVLGAKKAIAGTFINGLKTMGEKLGGAAADWTAHDQLTRINYMRESFVEDYVNTRVNADEIARNLQNLQTRNNIDNAADAAQVKQESGTKRGWWGAILGVGIVAVGAALCATGVGAVVGAGLVVAGAGVAVGGTVAYSGYSEWREGKLDARAANSARIDWRTQNMELHRFASNNTTEVRNMDALRSGLANRGEFWNLVDAPTAVPKNLAMINANLLADLERNSGRRYSAEAAGAADSVQAGLDIATRGRLRY